MEQEVEGQTKAYHQVTGELLACGVGAAAPGELPLAAIRHDARHRGLYDRDLQGEVT